MPAVTADEHHEVNQLQNVEKCNSWSHAIVTVESQNAKDQAQDILCSKHIAGVCLACCDVGEDLANAQPGTRPSKRARPASAEQNGSGEKLQKASNAKVWCAHVVIHGKWGISSCSPSSLLSVHRSDYHSAFAANMQSA